MDQHSPVRLEERTSHALQDRRARKVSKWDVQGGPPDLSAQQQMQPSLADPTASLKRKSSVEEGLYYTSIFHQGKVPHIMRLSAIQRFKRCITC